MDWHPYSWGLFFVDLDTVRQPRPADERGKTGVMRGLAALYRGVGTLLLGVSTGTGAMFTASTPGDIQ